MKLIYKILPVALFIGLIEVGISEKSAQSTSVKTLKKSGNAALKQHSKIAVPLTNAEKDAAEEWRALGESAMKAYKAHEYSEAIAEFKKMKKIGLVPSLTSMMLARSYSKLGEDRGVYDELKTVIYPPRGSFSSFENDPRVLAFYGDLCFRLGFWEESSKSFIKACRAGAIQTSNPEPLQSLMLNFDGNGKTREELRSAALASCAMAQLPTDGPKAGKYAEQAVALDEKSILARLAYSQTFIKMGNWGNAAEQAWEAEHLSGGDLADEIRQMRKTFHIFDGGVSTVYSEKTGILSSKAEPYRPLQRVLSPSSDPSFSVSLPEE